MSVRSVRHLIVSALALASLACSASDPALNQPPPPPATAFTISSAYGISASAAAVHDPQARLRFAVTVTNGSAADEQIEYGGCWASIRLFLTPDRSGSPSYDSRLGSAGCAPSETHLTLPAGQSAELVGFIDLSAIVASGLAPGHYYVSILVSPNGASTPIAAGEIDVQP